MSRIQLKIYIDFTRFTVKTSVKLLIVKELI